jgi:hypothetical protein
MRPARAFRIDEKRYPWRRVVFVQIYWLARRRPTYAVGERVLECGHSETLPKIYKVPRVREAATRRMRCRVCEPKSLRW